MPSYQKVRKPKQGRSTVPFLFLQQGKFSSAAQQSRSHPWKNMDLGISGSNFSRAPEESKTSAPEAKPLQPRARGGQPRSSSSSANNTSQPKRMTRASQWTADVENAFRFQCAGWRSAEEYCSEYDELQTWPANEYGEFVKMLRVKKNGNFMYFRQTRECEDKHLNKVKLYEY